MTKKKNISLYNPCISIYLPTKKKLGKRFKARHRVKFMRIISKIEKHLVSNLVDNSMIQGIIKPAKDCLEDSKFWINQEESLVIFMAENFFEYYQLPVPTELAIYIDTEFKVTPLASMMENTPLHKTEKVKHQISRLEVIQKIA